MAPGLCCLIRNRQKIIKIATTEITLKIGPGIFSWGFFLFRFTHTVVCTFPKKSPLKTGNVWYVRICVKLQKMLVRWRRWECWQHEKKKQTHETIFLLPILGFCIGGLHILYRPLLAGTGFFLYLLFTTEIRKNMGGCSKNGLESS